MSREQVLEEQLKDPAIIRGLFGPYRPLSNFHLCPVHFAFMEFPSSENAFQAAKFSLPDRWRFTECSPSDAKRLGGSMTMLYSPEQWDGMRTRVMRTVLLDKFKRNKDLRELLFSTQGKVLEETNWWKDRFWGVYEGEGENHMGKLLMRLRDEERHLID
jgi:N-glycosidase YbiA